MSDIFFYTTYGVRTNALATELFTNLKVVVPMLAHGYHLLGLFSIYILLAFGFILLHKRLQANISKEDNKHKAAWFLLILIVFSILSFLYYGPPLWYLNNFSDSSMLNQASSNGVYTLLKSFDQGNNYRKDTPEYLFYNRSTALNQFQKLISNKEESFVNANFPSLRKSITSQSFRAKNIVIVLEESFGAKYIGCLNTPHSGYSPCFDSISSEGILFTQCFANGPRTQNAIVNTTAAFPAVLGNFLIRRTGVNEFQTLGNILQSLGYKNTFICGGDASYDNMDMFLKQGGFRNIYGEKEFTSYLYKNEWGVSDEDLFRKAYSLLWDDHKPTFTVILTMSNHAPFDLPAYFKAKHSEITGMSKKQSCFYYADYALGQFISHCRKNKSFKNTLFLIMADHGEPYDEGDYDFKIFHIPALLLNSNKEPRRMDKVCSQIDLSATLLHQIGYSGPYHMIGQNVFDKGFHPFAVCRNYDDVVYYCTSNEVIRLDLRRQELKTFTFTDNLYLRPLDIPFQHRKNDEQALKCYLQSLSYIFRTGKYRFN
jgi:phosphoglycerol transferase MdoB-like AlkP superfamily enzyme